MEAFEDIEGQTLERFYNKYIKSNGDKKYQFVNLGVWTVNIKICIKKLTDEPENSNMYRIVVRGTVYARRRPGIRFGGGSLIAPLKIRDITAPNNKDNKW